MPVRALIVDLHVYLSNVFGRFERGRLTRRALIIIITVNANLMHQFTTVTNTHRTAVSTTRNMANMASIAVSIPRFIVIISTGNLHTISSIPLPGDWRRQ
jgi:hypothetical protein